MATLELGRQKSGRGALGFVTVVLIVLIFIIGGAGFLWYGQWVRQQTIAAEVQWALAQAKVTETQWERTIRLPLDRRSSMSGTSVHITFTDLKNGGCRAELFIARRWESEFSSALQTNSKYPCSQKPADLIYRLATKVANDGKRVLGEFLTEEQLEHLFLLLYDLSTAVEHILML